MYSQTIDHSTTIGTIGLNRKKFTNNYRTQVNANIEVNEKMTNSIVKAKT